MQKRSVQLPEYYDFILLDVQMPVVDGRTAARTIRAMNRPDAKTVLMFALSADAFVEDERLSAKSGMNGHLQSRWILPHCSAALASFCASAAGKRESEGVPETPLSGNDEEEKKRTWEGAPLGKFRRQYTGCRGVSSSGRPPHR